MLIRRRWFATRSSVAGDLCGRSTRFSELELATCRSAVHYTMISSSVKWTILVNFNHIIYETNIPTTCATLGHVASQSTWTRLGYDLLFFFKWRQERELLSRATLEQALLAFYYLATAACGIADIPRHNTIGHGRPMVVTAHGSKKCGFSGAFKAFKAAKCLQ